VLPLTDPGETDTLVVEGDVAVAGDPPQVAVRPTMPGYFDAVGVPLVQGELFTDASDSASLPVALISHALARQFFPGRNPIGARIQLGRRSTVWRTVVGVVGDVHHEGPERPAVPEVYVPMAQGYPYGAAAIAVRVDNNPRAFIPALRAVVAGLDPDLPLAAIRPMREVVDEAAAGRRASTILLTTFAGLSLLLALVGVYGVLAHGVSQRTQEIGVRMALGAQRSGVLLMVVRQGMVLALIGLAAGQVLALAGGHIARSMLFGVQPTDPVTLVVVAVTVVGSAVMACYLPARRAASLDPVTALRR
jgi:putative ABC transport system permease protein